MIDDDNYDNHDDNGEDTDDDDGDDDDDDVNMHHRTHTHIPHTIHGTNGLFTYIYHTKINHSWIGKYTVRPMDGIWAIYYKSLT